MSLVAKLYLLCVYNGDVINLMKLMNYGFL